MAWVPGGTEANVIGSKMLSEKDIAFVKAVRQAVKDKGRDFNYYKGKHTVDCQYFENDGSPSCLIGYGLAGVGYTKNDLENMNPNGRANYEVCSKIMPILGFHPGVVKAARYSQISQDQGDNWGKAIDEFETSLKIYNIIVD